MNEHRTEKISKEDIIKILSLLDDVHTEFCKFVRRLSMTANISSSDALLLRDLSDRLHNINLREFEINSKFFFGELKACSEFLNEKITVNSDLLNLALTVSRLSKYDLQNE